MAEVAFNLVPTRSGDRVYRSIDFMAIQICFGIAAWFFLVGSLTGLVLPAKEALPVIMVGNSLPLFLMAPMALFFARYGCEQFVGTSAICGHRFKDIWLFLYITSSYGWIAYASFLFGLSAMRVTEYFQGPEFLTLEFPGAVLYAYLAIFIGAIIAWAGPYVLKWFMRAAAAFLLGVLGWFISTIIGVYTWPTVMAQPPPQPFPQVGWSRASAMEWNVGLGFSWAFWYGQWTRLAKSESSAYHGCLWGWGAIAFISGAFAALVALMVGEYDPTIWIVTIAKEWKMPMAAVIGLILFGVANITSVACLIYPMSISFISRFPRTSWNRTILYITLPGFFLASIPAVFYAYGNYLSVIAALTGIYAGLFMGDYYFITRGTWSLRQLYNRAEGYKYWRGFNPAAVIATIIGAIFYFTTINPITWESYNGLFPYITAGIPVFFITMFLYVILMKFWVMKKWPLPVPLPKSQASVGIESTT